jgi:acetolactate decarboxylase
MKYIHVIFITIFSMMTLLCGCTRSESDNDVIFQVSTIDALMAGIYDHQMDFDELGTHGDTGIGTFTDLDGEMIGVDGKFYQIKVDGMAYPVDDRTGTPFAVVTFFEPDIQSAVSDKMDFTQLQEYIDGLLPTQNIFYAVKIEGVFSYLKVRSVPKQSKPYPPLTEAVEHQAIFEYNDQQGIVVGFRTPAYMNGLNVPGYHFHFISDDHKFGGHVLDCVPQHCEIEIDETRDLTMQLPENNEFYRMTFNAGDTASLDSVEK